MVANTYHWISLVRHAGHRVLAHPVRLPQTGHLIVISTSLLELKMASRELLQSLTHRVARALSRRRSRWTCRTLNVHPRPERPMVRKFHLSIDTVRLGFDVS